MDKHIEEIYSPRYQGERFSQHRMPLDLLEDLETLQKMTIDMAKYLYLEKNGKKRIPKNFTHGISFELESINQGSTIPKIVLITSMVGLFPQHNIVYFKEASKKIVDAIEVAENEENKTFQLPENVLFHFNNLGKKLQDDESIEFKPESFKSKAKFTKDSRKRLILASSKANQYSAEINVKGLITAVDKIKQSFDIQLMNGEKVKGTYKNIHQDAIMEAFNRMESKQKIVILGNGIYNSGDKLINIHSIEDISLLDTFDVATRLEELSFLNDGWMNGEGINLDKDGLIWLAEHFELNYNSELLPLPATFPTLDGHIQFEWTVNNYEVSLEVNLQDKSGDFYGINIQTKEETTTALDLLNSNDWQKLNELIASVNQQIV